MNSRGQVRSPAREVSDQRTELLSPSNSSKVMNEYLRKVSCGNADVTLVLCLGVADSYSYQPQRTTEMGVVATRSTAYASNFAFITKVIIHI